MRIIEEKQEKRENVITAVMDKCCRTEYPSGLIILYAIGTDDGLPTERIRIDKWTDIHSGDIDDVFTKKLLRLFIIKLKPIGCRLCSGMNLRQQLAISILNASVRCFGI